jgi:hypothetical protein
MGSCVDGFRASDKRKPDHELAAAFLDPLNDQFTIVKLTTASDGRLNFGKGGVLTMKIRWTMFSSFITALAISAIASTAWSQTTRHAEKPTAASLTRLQKQLDEQASRLQKLEREINMPATITQQAGSGVGLIVGEYIWTNPTGRKPLRYQGFSRTGQLLRDENGKELASFDGAGPVIVREFSTSAFAVDSKYVLTSGYILSPWSSDPLLDDKENPEIVPSITMLHVYFPEVKKALDLEIKSATEERDAVLCTIKGTESIRSRLSFANTVEQTKEVPIIMLGYPGGVALLMSRVPDDVRREINKFGSPSMDEMAELLAERGYIHPIAFQSRISGTAENRLFFETFASYGSTGGPLINADGLVVGMSQSIHSAFPSFNMAIALASLKSWIQETISRAETSLRQR